MTKAKHPIATNRIDHVVLLVSDLARARKFYTEVLGMWEERFVESINLAQMRAGRSLVDLQLTPGRRVAKPAGKGKKAREAPMKGRNMHHFALNLDVLNEKRIRAHMKKHKIKIGETRKLYGADGSGKAIDIIDPDGNIVELKGPITSQKAKREASKRRAAAKRKALVG
ncbi:MAG: VOC family protein [Alphaproteobacteria bacterium]|nr:VOC family protein [Alphaproteobacteria bacterium]